MTNTLMEAGSLGPAQTHASEATITFAAGIPGFEACRRFVLVQAPQFDPGMCLKGIDAPSPTFFALDPRRIVPGYDCDLSVADLVRLGASSAGECVWLVIVSCAGDRPMVNLGAPIVINPNTMRGLQIVPPEAAGPVEVPWAEAVCSS